MGQICSKQSAIATNGTLTASGVENRKPMVSETAQSALETYSAVSPFPSPMTPGVGSSKSPSMTPGYKFRWPLPPPSPAKPIIAAMRRRKATPKGGLIPEDGDGEDERLLDKRFGYSKNFAAKFELGREVGRGHFGHTCQAKGRKGDLRGQNVAVKIISKAKMTTAISIEDVRREVKILKALSGHKNTVKFHGSFEDSNNVYIVMELCEGGELLERILARGGRYIEEDAKTIVVQILNIVAFCHLQGVVHRDLKPENFLFTTTDEGASMKIIDFGLSEFVRPDQLLSDIVGSAYYVAPEVLQRAYGLEADIWSIGVITYILLCGSRPFWARTESGIFRSVIKTNPNFDDSPWPAVSPEAKDFVKRLLNKDPRKRMTAVQAMTHPWVRDECDSVPLDVSIYKQVKEYVHAAPFRCAALKALSKSLTEDELVYLRAQFQLLEPKEGRVFLTNFRVALVRNFTDAMKESRFLEILNMMEPLSYKKMGFEEFCSAAISTYHLEALEGWEKMVTTAFGFFEQVGNRPISVAELAQEMNISSTSHSLLNDWIRSSDGKLSFHGYTKVLHGVKLRSLNSRQL